MAQSLMPMLLALLVPVISAAAEDPTIRCERTKLKVASKYCACRLTAEAKGVKEGTPPDFTKCDLKFGTSWQRAEEQAAGQCPTTGDLAATQRSIAASSATLADALMGLRGSCGFDYPQCNGACPASQTCAVLKQCGNGLGVGTCDTDADCEPFGCLPAGCQCVPLTGTKRVFVTGDAFTGDLGGLAGADALCQSHADRAGLPGTYRAWLSTFSTESASERLTHASTPYVRVDGKVVANGWADLTDGTLQNAIDVDATGAVVGGILGFVWTCTDANGDFDQFHCTVAVPPGPSTAGTCDEWTSNGEGPFGPFSGGIGEVASTNQEWTDQIGFVRLPCSDAAHLYCLEQ